MDIRTHSHRFVIAALLLTLAACSGGGNSDGGGGPPPPPPPPQSPAPPPPAPPPPPQQPMIGAAGGTVLGPNGAMVVIPAGALASDTPIAIELTSAGTPPLPAGFSAFGQMFAFTPHGTTFAEPVTVTLPFDLASRPAGTTPALYKTNGQNQWEHVATATFKADSLSAKITSFSGLTAVIPPLTQSDPLRVWTFSEFRTDALEEVEVAADTQLGGFMLERFDHGPAVFDTPFAIADGTSIPSDGIATGHILSTADGVTYAVGTSAPLGSLDPDGDEPIGSKARLLQYQTFTKNASDATYEFTLSLAFVDVFDGNTVLSRECPPGRELLGAACDLIQGEVFLDVQAYTDVPNTPKIIFFRTAGGASLNGGATVNELGEPRASWLSSVWNEPFSRIPLWDTEDFDFVAADFNGPEGILNMHLRNPRTYTVDLSSVAVGESFTVKVVTHASTYNRAARSVSGTGTEFGTAANAALRDPLSIGGTTVTTTGLTPINTAVPLVEPVEVPVSPAACVPGPGPDPASGVLQFSAAGYSLAEASSTPTITVTRTGGSVGAVTATFTTSDGSAIGGTDYTPVNASVFFADGDAVSRVVRIPIIQDLISAEPDKTVNLTLSQPGGCAALGAQTTAVLTIRDDDPLPPPPSFTIGGTVAGLVGTGLVLQDLQNIPITPGNGAFTFSLPTRSGSPYAVTIVTQPTNPVQVCTVTNGSGTVANANITNVEVDCDNPVVSGALDTSFGGVGKVSTAFGGDETAMALQADGKIVMAGGSAGNFVLARYNADGSLDAGFGDGGLVTTDVGNGAADEARGVGIQSDGKVVVVGYVFASHIPGNPINFDFALMRYNTDGSLDTSFGDGGKVTTDFNGLGDRAFGVAIQPDDKIVVVGEVGIFDTQTSLNRTDFGLARYDSNGTLDLSFSGDGKVTTDFDINIADVTDSARNVVLQGNGAILVSGPLTTATGLARYDSNGDLDASFGTGGTVHLPGAALGEGLAIQGDGKILLVNSPPQFGLMRLEADGSPDGSFGFGGRVTTTFSALGDFSRAVAVQADDKIVVAGESSNQSNSDFAVARYLPNGTLDLSFGLDGKLTIDFFGSFDGAENVAVQPDGKIVLGGFALNGTRIGYGLTRVVP